MPRHPDYLPHGRHSRRAAAVPHEDLSIDERSYRAHLRDVATVEGISALTVNAHASEVASCSFDEQRRVLEITQDEVGARAAVVNGIYAEGSLEAARIASMAHEGGPRRCWSFLRASSPSVSGRQMAVAHFRRIADATDLPLIVFPVPACRRPGLSAGDAARDHRRSVPTVRAIKDWCANPQLHERQIRMLQALHHRSLC